MDFRLVCKQLSVVALLIGLTMVFSMPFAWPALGHRTDEKYADLMEFESQGFLALAISIVISGAVGALLWWLGRESKGQLYRKEAMAIVGLSWVLATLLGATPYLLSGTYRGASVRVFPDNVVQVYGHEYEGKEALLGEQVRLIKLLVKAGARGLTPAELKGPAGDASPQLLHQLADRDARWRRALIFPEESEGPPDRRGNYRIRWIHMTLFDALFESQSGFSTTGATVITDLEDPNLVPRCILFWRSSTHFLGGLGIIVLFVAILGQGSAGKALMRAEMPGPSKEGSQARMQHTAWTVYDHLRGAQRRADGDSVRSKACRCSTPFATPSARWPPAASAPTTPASGISRTSAASARPLIEIHDRRVHDPGRHEFHAAVLRRHLAAAASCWPTSNGGRTSPILALATLAVVGLRALWHRRLRAPNDRPRRWLDVTSDRRCATACFRSSRS